MMSTYPSPVPKPDLFEFYSRKLRAICELHGVTTGPGQSLDGFLGKLDSDRHFAMDFWGLVGKLSAREGGDLNDDQMLALLIAVVTGRPVTALGDHDADPAVALLRAMLSGVDVQRTEPAGSAQTSATSVRVAPVASIEEARPKLAQIDESRARRFSAGLASVPRPPDPDPFPVAQIPPASIPAPPAAMPAASGPPTALPSQLHLALQSLEIVSRDMNDHVQKIDQRLVRMEAQTKKIIARTEVLGGPALRSADYAAANKRGVVTDAAAAMAGEHRMFETFPSLRDVHWRQNVTIGVVLLSLIAGGITWRYYSPWILFKIHQFVREDISTPPGSIWGQDRRPPVLLPSPAPAAQTPRESSAPRTASTAQQPQAPQPEDERAQTASGPSTTELDHDAIRAEQDIARLASVVVSEIEMDNYLIASRVPVYPDEARMARVRGSVVAQALVSKDGTVTRVHVIEGDPRLRSAATDAIYKRRYRPYYLNGEPVEVATTITINFRPNGARRSRYAPEG
jgi:TonB family protein